MKSCFFIGHRDTPAEIYGELLRGVENLICDYGVSEFIVGHYGAFDRMAAGAVIEAKKKYSGISLVMLLPYHPGECPIELPEGFDSTFYPPGMERVPRKVAIVRANRYMAEHVEYLLSYAWHPGSNARELTDYALRRGVKVTNLACISL